MLDPVSIAPDVILLMVGAGGIGAPTDPKVDYDHRWMAIHHLQ